MVAELKRLAGEFSAQPLTRGREMRDLLEQAPEDFCAAAVEILAGEEAERVKRYIVALLWTNNRLIPCLTDASTSLKQAESIAALARRVDPQLPAKLVGFALEQNDLESGQSVERILGLLKSMPDAASFRPLLTPLLRHPNPRIRSQVALLVGEGNQNRTWFERRMQEDDPRVRANAIESAGPSMAKDLRPMFQAALSDSNNRVVGNALISLYRLGDTEAVANLYELISHPDPAFRATAVWAMGETGDTRFLPALTKTLTAANENNKGATIRAIKKLRERESAAARPLAVRVLSEPSLCDSTLKIVFSASERSCPANAIPATAVRILINDEFAHRYSVAEQESRRRIVAAFLLPPMATQPWEQVESYRNALERCFERRRTGDAWLFSQHSGSTGAAGAVSPRTLFGERIDSFETSNIQAIENLPGLRTAFGARIAMRPDFTAIFQALCQELRPSRFGGHLFLLHPETARAIVAQNLVPVAREARVAVHAICAAHHPGIRDICHATSGFYLVGESMEELLPTLYRGISHRYEATVTADADVRQVQVIVRSPEFFGESPVVTMHGWNGSGPPIASPKSEKNPQANGEISG